MWCSGLSVGVFRPQRGWPLRGEEPASPGGIRFAATELAPPPDVWRIDYNSSLSIRKACRAWATPTQPSRRNGSKAAAARTSRVWPTSWPTGTSTCRSLPDRRRALLGPLLHRRYGTSAAPLRTMVPPARRRGRTASRLSARRPSRTRSRSDQSSVGGSGPQAEHHRAGFDGIGHRRQGVVGAIVAEGIDQRPVAVAADHFDRGGAGLVQVTDRSVHAVRELHDVGHRALQSAETLRRQAFCRPALSSTC